MEDCQALVGLWLDAAVVAVILLICICCTTNGGYKRPQVCPFQTVCVKGTAPNDEKAQCQIRVVWQLESVCSGGLYGGASLNSREF